MSGGPSVLRGLAVGATLTVALFCLFLYAGPHFFIDGRRAFQINFALAGLAGFALGWFSHVLAGGPKTQAQAAVVLIAAPPMLVMAAVASHFGVFFPALDPALDKVFGSWMLWLFGFALVGAVLRGRVGRENNEGQGGTS